MSKEQASVTELLLSLDSSDLEEAESVRAAINLQLSTDRGGAVLSSLVDYYLDYSSPQAVLLLSSTREPHHKFLLEKLNEALSKPGFRLPTLTLLGHLVRNQLPWIHHISRSTLLPSLLRCLKTDSDVVVLITGVLVLITLLPMIPQAGKPHIYDFFDVFGRLASWSLKNPGHVPGVQLVHLHAGVYSLFHRLYGMFPCNFMSYLRLHYSMKENLDTFQEIVKPMLEHVRVHPELVTGTQDYELDPSRWRCYEVHDILIECSRLSLDPLESSCEEDLYSSPRPPPLASPPLSNLNLTFSPESAQTPGDSGSVFPSLSGCQLSFNPTIIQADDATWSPSSHCGLTTPPPEPATPGSTHLLTRTTSISGGKYPSSASVPVTPLPIIEREGSSFQPIREQDPASLSDVVTAGVQPEDALPPHSVQHHPFASTPSRFTSGPASLLTPYKGEEEGPAPPYNQLFDLALPHAAALFIKRKTTEVLERSEEGQEMEGGTAGEDGGEEETVSPLKVLDQLIILGHDSHQALSKRLSASWRSVDRLSGGCAEDLQSVRNQLFLVHTQLQFERFKRQQHAVRNRRLLRRVVNTTALEEHSAAMRAQLASQDQEMFCLRLSLQEEQRRYAQLQHDSNILKETLQDNIRTLLQQQEEGQREGQRLQSELQECQSRLRDVEAELQRANNKVYNSEHQLTQLSFKLSSSEQLQQQIVLLNQQMILLRESNRTLSQQLEAGHTHCCTEASMLQCTVGQEFQRLKDSEVQNRQKLEAANHRSAELENQLSKKEQLILEQKKLLEDTKAQSRAELAASDSCCVALRRLVQKLQTEMLHLYGQIQPQDSSRPNGGGDSSPLDQRPRPSSAAVAVINGAVEALSSSPLSLPPHSSSPIDSPLTAGSFLEQHARQMFGPTNQSLDEAEHREEEEEEENEEQHQPESPPLGQEAEEEEEEGGGASLLAGSPQMEPPGWPAPPNASTDLTLAVRQRRHELSIMDYDELLPEV